MEIAIGLVLLIVSMFFLLFPASPNNSVILSQEHLSKRYPNFSEEDIRILSYISDETKRSQFLRYLLNKYQS